MPQAASTQCVHPPGNVFTCSQAPAQKKGERTTHNRQPLPPFQQKTVAATYSPTPPQGSTISARRLNDRVRNETECNPPTITTTETKHPHPSRHGKTTVNKHARAPNYLQRTSPRPISTGQLHPSQGFHTRPINPVIYREPYPLTEAGDLISKQASRLDAFSGYLSRT